MMSKWINDSSNAPAVRVIADRPDDGRARGDCPIKNGIPVVHHQDHAHRAAAKRFGTKIKMFRRLVREPELGPVHRQASHNLPFFVFDAKQFAGSERPLVESNCTGPPSNRKQRRNGRFMMSGWLWVMAHEMNCSVA